MTRLDCQLVPPIRISDLDFRFSLLTLLHPEPVSTLNQEDVLPFIGETAA